MSMKNKYPMYIVSKGRADSRLTSKALEAMGLMYFIIVEAQEYEEYAKVIDPHKVLILHHTTRGTMRLVIVWGRRSPKAPVLRGTSHGITALAMVLKGTGSWMTT